MQGSPSPGAKGTVLIWNSAPPVQRLSVAVQYSSQTAHRLSPWTFRLGVTFAYSHMSVRPAAIFMFSDKTSLPLWRCPWLYPSHLNLYRMYRRLMLKWGFWQQRYILPCAVGLTTSSVWFLPAYRQDLQLLPEHSSPTTQGQRVFYELQYLQDEVPWTVCCIFFRHIEIQWHSWQICLKHTLFVLIMITNLAQQRVFVWI